jgi:hypothetical protein
MTGHLYRLRRFPWDARNTLGTARKACPWQRTVGRPSGGGHDDQILPNNWLDHRQNQKGELVFQKRL